MRLIDADALKKTLEKLWNVHDDDDFANKDVWREIENAPTIEPERKKGKWIKHENPTLGQCLKIVYECSVCHMGVGCEYFVRKSFCPNCGSEMTGGE